MKIDSRSRKVARWVSTLVVGGWIGGTTALTVEAGPLWDCLTGKKPAGSTCGPSGCNSPAGGCNSPAANSYGAPSAGAPAGAAPGQPYMVPIGPPRIVPGPAGSTAPSTAPSLAPTGAMAPPSLSPAVGASTGGTSSWGVPTTGTPALVSRPVWPASSVPVTQNPYPFAVPPTGSTVQTVYYQAAPMSPSTVPSTVPPNFATGAPVAPGGLPATVQPGAPCPSCQQPVAVNYAPYTAYRDRTVQSPTTLYRPVAAVDPRTGATVTVLQPCQTTTTQVQRVPVGLSRSFVRAYRPIPVKNPPVAAARPVVVAAPLVAAPAVAGPVYYYSPAPVVAPSGYAAAPAYATAPTYAAPSSTVAPSTYMAPAAPAYTPPTYAGPSYGAASSGAASSVPGSSAPPSNGSTIPLPPPPASSTPGAPAGVDPADQRPALSSPARSGAGFRPSFPDASTAPPADAWSDRGAGGAKAPSTESAPRSVAPGVRPIPLPEPPSDAEGRRDSASETGRDDGTSGVRAPALIKVPTEDRSARSTPFAPVGTAANVPVSIARNAGSATPSSPQPTSLRTVVPVDLEFKRLDDSGWRSLAR